MKKLIVLFLCLSSPLANAAYRGGAGNYADSASSVTVTVSGIGIQLNDVVVCMVEVGNQSGNTITWPSGFSAPTGAVYPGTTLLIGATTNQRAELQYKIATASEPTTYTFNYSTSDHMAAQCRVYSGRNYSSPFSTNAVPTFYTTANSPISYVLNGITAATSDDVVSFIANQYYNGTSPTYSAPSGFANALLTASSTTYGQILASTDKVNSASGAQGTAGGTYTLTGGTALAYGAFQVSIKAGSACTHAGFTSAGAIAVPNGSSGSYLLKNGSFGTPDCSTVNYWQPALSNFGAN